MPIIQENPTYFTDRVHTMDMNQVCYKKGSFGGSNSKIQGIRNYQNNKRGPLASDDTDSNELDVFLSSCDSNSSSYTDNGMHSMNGGQEHPFSRSENNSGTGQRKGLGQKIGQLFWKSKSKHSVGSESQASGSTIESVGIGSPRFTPDSSLSICTSSLEGGDSSNSSSSNQISPKDRNKRENVTTIDDQTAFYRFDDCERYAANMYYNMGDSSSYTCRVQQLSRPRNNSVPVSNTSVKKNLDTIGINEIEDCVLPYYNNTTFSTFPNPRRHSISYSSGSSTAGTGTREQHELQQVIEHDRDGYLRPNEPRNLRNVKNLCYINEPTYSNSSLDGGRVQVHVDVHTPTSSSLNTEFEAFNSPRRHRSFETSAGTTTDDSQSTVVASSVSYIPFYHNHDGEISSTSRRGKDNNNERIIPKDRVLPMYMSRILSVGTDCEPYCSLCASTNMLASISKKTRMDVAIVSCQECFFSKNAEAHIRGFFDKLITSDKQKMDVVLQSYDVKDLDHPNVAAEVHRSKVQILIISHLFLQRLKSEATTRVRLSPVNRVFRSKRVIAVLVGVNQTEINEGYEAVLARFGEWFHVELRSTTKLDPEFCKKFTEQVVKIYNVELCNTNNFSVFPKKVTREQPKIVMMFKKPVNEDDEIRIEFSCGRKTESLTNLKMENPCTAIIRVPDNLSPDRSCLIEVTVFVNNHKLGATWVKSELQSKYNDEDIIERMANMLPGFLSVLDDHVSQALSKNYKDCTDYVTDPMLEIMNDVLICKGDEFSTIMHFAAYYGLEHTVWTLLDEADGLEQCRIINEKGDSPADVAVSRGYENTVQIISDYQDISNSWKALRYMQDLCGRASVVSLSEQKIVSKIKRSQEIIQEEVLYENVEIINEESENNDLEKFPAEISADDKGSDGSYINWESTENDSQQSQHYEKVEEHADNKEEEVKPEQDVPKPTLRSPRKKQLDYINLNSETRVTENPEGVRRRREATATAPKPKYTHHREAAKRHSISPMQNYDIPRFANQDYSIPPTGDPRPVLPEKPRGQNSPILIKKVTGSIPTQDGYLIMDLDQEEGVKKEEPSYIDSKELDHHYEDDIISKPNLINGDQTQSCDQVNRSESKSISSYVTEFPSEPVAPPLATSPKEGQTENGNISLDPIDEELVQLMKEFPSSGYTMRQIELLFENWKSRSDVKRSIEDKKIYMKNMRDEYKRIQQQAMQNTKKPSPLERIKVLITGRKKSTNVSPLSPVNISEHSEMRNFNQFTTKQEDNRNLSQSRASDRGSFGSHSSGGSMPDSGVSEPDSEKDKDREKGSCNKGEGSCSPKPIVWGDPLNKRFCPSYIGPDVPIPPSQTFEEHGSSYKIPPPARPLTNPPPTIPHKPSVTSIPEYPINYNQPPPPPKKPGHMRSNEDGNPPAPPPRNYKPPNVFNYIDYKQKNKEMFPNKNDPKKSIDHGRRPPYDNVL